jgi:hypothetical protein
LAGGPAEHLTQSSERTGIENNWFALTGRVVAVKVEMDGDLHLALQDATGDKPGIVVCEVPAKKQWCEIRTTVFSWTHSRFPFHTSSARKLTVDQPPVIKVIGKAYFDVGHALKDQSNRRSHLPDYAAWEIHPVMKIEVSDSVRPYVLTSALFASVFFAKKAQTNLCFEAASATGRCFSLTSFTTFHLNGKKKPV